MRTTIDIPDALHKSMKARCVAEGTTMQRLIVEISEQWMRHLEERPRIETKCILTDVPKRRRKIARFANPLIPFLGIARKGANLDVSHDWRDIKKSIEEGWAEDAMEKERRVCEE